MSLTKKDKIFYVINIAIIAIFSILWIIGNFITPGSIEFEVSLFQSIFLIIAAGFAGILCSYIALKYKISTTIGKVWLTIGLGMFGWMIGDIIYTYFDLFTGEAPFPSIADLFYLLAYAPLSIGFIIQAKVLKNKLSKLEKILLTTSYLIISIIIIFIVLIFPIQNWYEGSVIPVEDIFGITIASLYPLFDLILLACVMVVFFKLRKGKINTAWILLIFGMLFTIAGDILFNWKENVIEFSDIWEFYDLLLLLGYIFIYMGGYTLITTVSRSFEKLNT